jgi:hypothetical protein
MGCLPVSKVSLLFQSGRHCAALSPVTPEKTSPLRTTIYQIPDGQSLSVCSSAHPLANTLKEFNREILVRVSLDILNQLFQTYKNLLEIPCKRFNRHIFSRQAFSSVDFPKNYREPVRDIMR